MKSNWRPRERGKLPSGVWGGAPVEIELDELMASKSDIRWQQF